MKLQRISDINHEINQFHLAKIHEKNLHIHQPDQATTAWISNSFQVCRTLHESFLAAVPTQRLAALRQRVASPVVPPKGWEKNP